MIEMPGSHEPRTRLSRGRGQFPSGKLSIVSPGERSENLLYRATYSTFEDYCRERWGMSRIHAFRLIQAAEVKENLLPIGNILTSESQARPLTSLPSEKQREAWAEAKLMNSGARTDLGSNGSRLTWLSWTSKEN